MAEKKWVRVIRECFVWTRNFHWLWTIFPATWKMALVAAAVFVVGLLLGIIRKAQTWFYAVLAVCVYVVTWCVIQVLRKHVPGLESVPNLIARTRSVVSNLAKFVDENEDNVTLIHFRYDSRFRSTVDQLFSELAAEEVCDILEGDWVINPKIQTARNIRENVIPQLTKSADRLEAKLSAPRSKLVGEIEAARFTVQGESIENGKRAYRTNLCVQLRITNQEKIETTLKRARVKVVIAGQEYRGFKTSLWDPRRGKDLLEYVTNETPIRHAVATKGLLEFTIDSLKCPDRGISADTTVVLIDEFEVPHSIRNKNLWIAAR